MIREAQAENLEKILILPGSTGKKSLKEDSNEINSYANVDSYNEYNTLTARQGYDNLSKPATRRVENSSRSPSRNNRSFKGGEDDYFYDENNDKMWFDPNENVETVVTRDATELNFKATFDYAGKQPGITFYSNTELTDHEKRNLSENVGSVNPEVQGQKGTYYSKHIVSKSMKNNIDGSGKLNDIGNIQSLAQLNQAIGKFLSNDEQNSEIAVQKSPNALSLKSDANSKKNLPPRTSEGSHKLEAGPNSVKNSKQTVRSSGYGMSSNKNTLHTNSGSSRGNFNGSSESKKIVNSSAYYQDNPMISPAGFVITDKD